MSSVQVIGERPPSAEGITMSRQKELPRLPVAPLQDTLRRYLDFVKPLLTAEELDETQKVVRDFGKPGGDGETLHKLLATKASRTQNWLSDWFLNEGYLRSRSPASSSAVAMVLPRQTFITKRDQLEHAAMLVAGALDFKHLIDRQLLKPEVKRTHPLDMSQFQNLFHVCRIPTEGCDKVEFHVPSDTPEEHVVVMHNGQIFVFNPHDARGVPHDEGTILTQLLRVVEMSQEEDFSLGILTAEDRDVWAKVYGRLSQNPQNAASLEAIKRVVCLDGRLTNPEPYEVSCPQQIYMGGINTENAANRWWDKPVQIIVGEDGLSALLCEHSTFEVTVMAGLVNHCADYV